MTPGIVRTLVKIWTRVIEKDMNSIHLQKDMDLDKNAYNNFQKLRYFGLVAKDKKNRGYWLITRRGAQFLHGKQEVNLRLKIFRNHIAERSETLVNIFDVLKCEQYWPSRDDFYQPMPPPAQDIAVHAGRICRYGGAVWYPLLPHLVFVGLMAYKRSGSVANLLWGFLHDAHEVVTSDVPRPFKCDCMRKEQNAIDIRLLNIYLPNHTPDYDLIKQCDTDALHIEAVEMNLPGFKEIELAYASDYCGEKSIYDNAEDRKLFHRIMDSMFGQNTIAGTNSSSVTAFEIALLYAEEGQYDEFLNEVRSWGLL